jgi:divalent metal cation (Fe/Co/Zn/Cd) transporter
MQLLTIGMNKEKESLYRWAYALAVITIFYNILEGLVSIYFGIEDETLALFGFGLDSFVEVISGVGIWHMIKRIKRNYDYNPDHFERQALIITGTAFYILSTGLIATALINIYQGHKPETTFWGIVISLISIVTMWLLIHYKIKVGKQLDSQAIIADANCTKACLYLSIILLLLLLVFHLKKVVNRFKKPEGYPVAVKVIVRSKSVHLCANHSPFLYITNSNTISSDTTHMFVSSEQRTT